MSKQKEEIEQILADNIFYSPQIQGVIIHGVIEKLAAREDMAEERGYKRGSFHTGMFAIAVVFLAGIAFNLHNASSPQPSLPPASRIVIDTSRDSSYLDYRQASPEVNHLYDSTLNDAYLKTHKVTTGTAERRGGK